MSLSRQRMPWRAISWLKPTSSLTMDLPLTMLLTPFLGDTEDDGVGLGRRLGPVHPDAVALTVGFELLQRSGRRETALANLLRRIAHRRFFLRVGEGIPALGAQVIHGAAKILAQHGSARAASAWGWKRRGEYLA